MAKPYLDDADAWLLDGFPRNEAQAKALDDALKDLGIELDAAVALEAPDDELVERLSGRRTSDATGRVYHVEHDPPPEDSRRTPALRAAQGRHRGGHPPPPRHLPRADGALKDYYAERGLLTTVDARQSIRR
jgi:adenylate kinase